MNFRINVRAIIPFENKLFLVKANRNNVDYYALPGGGLDNGENLKDALEREIIEEIGVKPTIGDLLYVQQIGSKGVYNLPEFFFLVTNGKDFLDIDVSNTSHGHELSEASFVDPANVHVLPEFLKQEWDEMVNSNFKLPVKLKFREISKES